MEFKELKHILAMCPEGPMLQIHWEDTVKEVMT
jgi:hypothetical protein